MVGNCISHTLLRCIKSFNNMYVPGVSSLMSCVLSLSILPAALVRCAGCCGGWWVEVVWWWIAADLPSVKHETNRNVMNRDYLPIHRCCRATMIVHSHPAHPHPHITNQCSVEGDAADQCNTRQVDRGHGDKRLAGWLVIWMEEWIGCSGVE